MEYLFWNGGSALCVKFACMERANENRQSTGYGYNYTTQACERWAMLARNKDDLQLQVRHWNQHSLAEPAKNLSPFAASCSHPGRPAAEPAKRYYVVGSSFVFSLLC